MAKTAYYLAEYYKEFEKALKSDEQDKIKKWEYKWGEQRENEEEQEEQEEEKQQENQAAPINEQEMGDQQLTFLQKSYEHFLTLFKAETRKFTDEEINPFLFFDTFKQLHDRELPDNDPQERISFVKETFTLLFNFLKQKDKKEQEEYDNGIQLFFYSIGWAHYKNLMNDMLYKEAEQVVESIASVGYCESQAVTILNRAKALMAQRISDRKKAIESLEETISDPSFINTMDNFKKLYDSSTEKSEIDPAISAYAEIYLLLLNYEKPGLLREYYQEECQDIINCIVDHDLKVYLKFSLDNLVKHQNKLGSYDPALVSSDKDKMKIFIDECQKNCDYLLIERFIAGFFSHIKEDIDNDKNEKFDIFKKDFSDNILDGVYDVIYRNIKRISDTKLKAMALFNLGYCTKDQEKSKRHFLDAIDQLIKKKIFNLIKYPATSLMALIKNHADKKKFLLSLKEKMANPSKNIVYKVQCNVVLQNLQALMESSSKKEGGQSKKNKANKKSGETRRRPRKQRRRNTARKKLSENDKSNKENKPKNTIAKKNRKKTKSSKKTIIPHVSPEDSKLEKIRRMNGRTKEIQKLLAKKRAGIARKKKNPEYVKISNEKLRKSTGTPTKKNSAEKTPAPTIEPKKIKIDKLASFKEKLNECTKIISDSQQASKESGYLIFMVGIFQLCEIFSQELKIYKEAKPDIKNEYANIEISEELMREFKQYRNAITHYLLNWLRPEDIGDAKAVSDDTIKNDSSSILLKIQSLFDSYFDESGKLGVKNKSTMFMAGPARFFLPESHVAKRILTAFPKRTEFDEVLNIMKNSKKPTSMLSDIEIKQFLALNYTLRNLPKENFNGAQQQMNLLIIMLMGSLIQGRGIANQNKHPKLKTFFKDVRKARNYFAHGGKVEKAVVERIQKNSEDAEKAIKSLLSNNQQPQISHSTKMRI